MGRIADLAKRWKDAGSAGSPGGMAGGAAADGRGQVWELAAPVGPDGPRSHLLNRYQRGALGSILPVAERAVRLAAAELEAVDSRSPAGDRLEAQRRSQLRAAIRQFSEQVDRLAVTYGLRYEERDWRVLLVGQLERAHQVLEDAAPDRLAGYGPVSPELRAALGADVAELQLALRAMREIVHQLRPVSG